MTDSLRPVVLAERSSRDGRVRWQARISEDRGRLELVAIVPPSRTPTIVPALTDAEVRALLTDVPTASGAGWVCTECRAVNDNGRRWCRVCSNHDTPFDSKRGDGNA